VETVRCITRFDITPTGVVGSYRDNQTTLNPVPGKTPDEILKDWTKARNQQRNWDTINQVIALRCLPENITVAHRDGDRWWFDFDLPNIAAVSDHPGDLEFLTRDADGVPMITGLGESVDVGPMIRSRGSDTNTWFQVRSDKYLRTGE